MIEDVTPSLDGGRHPLKRTVGDVLEVQADIYKDGHELLGACILHQRPGERRWRRAPLAYDYNNDRWRGTIPLERVGRWFFTIEGWTDLFGTWCRDLGKKHEAGLDVEVELLEGLALLKDAASRARGEVRATLAKVGALLGDRGIQPKERVEAAVSSEIRALVDAHRDPTLSTRHERVYAVTVDPERAAFAAWYEMFPRSQGTEPGKASTFSEAARRLPGLAALGFDVIYLPPIHPVGRTHRKGRDNTPRAAAEDPGSPWAIGNEHGGHTAVEPALGTLEDFRRFVRAAEDLGMSVALDYALQCSPDHPWLKAHPDWFFTRPDGSIRYAENPPKKYEDIVPLNFWCRDRAALWDACKEIMVFWIEQGVRIFRVDNPHTKPFIFWERLIAEVKHEHPETVFLSEAFTRPKPMKGLAKVGFTQSYTYFTWRNTAAELRAYLTELTQTEMAEYFRANLFVNTPDILHEYLQKGGRPAFRVRLLLAATLSPLYGIYSGFELCENVPLRPGSEEYLHSEKYEIRVRDWDAPGNLNADIARINTIRRQNRALQRFTNLTFLPSGNDQILWYRKSAPGNELLIAVNVNASAPEEGMVELPLAELGIGPNAPFIVEDLLTGERYTWCGPLNYVRLDPAVRPGHVFLLELPAGTGVDGGVA